MAKAFKQLKGDFDIESSIKRCILEGGFVYSKQPETRLMRLLRHWVVRYVFEVQDMSGVEGFFQGE
jgi:hypothetical protein